MRIGRQRGEQSQAIGRSRGGRTTKIHALTDRFCRPLAFLLTGGQAADCTAGALLLERLPPCWVLHADKGYDTDAIRRQVEDSGAAPNIPSKTTRRWKACSSPVLYKGRNAIACRVSRLKEFASRPFASAPSPPATTASPPTISPPSASPQPSATGYESGP